MKGGIPLLPLALLCAALLLATGCGPPADLTTVKGPYYSFNAPGSFRSVTPPSRDYPEVEDPGTLTELRDHHGTRIYAAMRRPAAGTDLAELLRGQKIVASQGVSRPVPIEVAGRPGMRIDGLRATGANGAAVGSRSAAFRDRGNVFVIGCRWTTDPEGARDACDQALASFKPR